MSSKQNLDGLVEAGRLVQSKFEGSAHRLVFTSLCAYVGTFSFGYTIGYSSSAIPDLVNFKLLETDQGAWFGALMTVGAIFGGPVAGWAIDAVGRKKTIMFTSIPFAVGWLQLIFFTDYTSLLSSRFLTGFASGMTTVCCPIYIAETSTKSLRGMLGSGIQLSITIGILAAYTAGMYLTYSTMAEIGLLIAIVLLIVMVFPPETPRWLLMKDRRAEAVTALTCLRGAHTDVEDECRDIEGGLDIKDTTVAWSEFLKPEYLCPLQISIGLMVFQQLSGINAVMFYTVDIFKSAGFAETGSFATVIIGAVQVAATFVACLLMDRAGRRLLLLIAGVLMALTCFSFGWYYHTLYMGDAADLGWVAMASLVLYILGFSLGWGPIPMLVMSEIFPSKIRGRASAIAILSNWTFAFLVTKEFVSMQETLGQSGTFWMFGVFCSIAVVFVWKFVPETKGKSLEDIELYFLGKS